MIRKSSTTRTPHRDRAQPPSRAVFPSSEAAPGRIGFFRQAEKDLHDPGVRVCCGVEKQTIINEARDRGHRSALFDGSWSDDRNGAELFVKEQSGLGHDQVGLELVSNIGTGSTGVGIDSCVEVREGKIAVRYIRGVACFILPSLEVRDLGAADTQKDPQDLQVGYFLGQRGIQAASALFDKCKMKSCRVRYGLQMI